MTTTVPYRVVSSLPAGTALSRYLKALTVGSYERQEFVETECRGVPQVAAAFEWEEKAATAAGSTTDSVWAGPLTTSGVLSDVRPLLEQTGVVDAVRSRFTDVPCNMSVPIESTLPNGTWVAEGAPSSVVSIGFSTAPALPTTKAVAIVVFTKEFALAGLPNTEAIVRRGTLSGQGRFPGQQLLNPAITATTARPASITNTGVSVTSTGSTAAAIGADLTSMVAAITTRGSGLFWLMGPKTKSTIVAANGGGAQDLPMLRGFPVVVHPDAAGQITLIDGPEILLADGGLDVDKSEQASVQMNDTPDDPTTASTVMTSMFQRNLAAFRCRRMIYWRAARSGAVSYMTVTY